MVAVRITEQASRRTNVKSISNLIGRRNQTITLTFIYSERLQSYIIVSLFRTYCRTERPITIRNSIRFGEFPNSRSTKQQKMKNWSQTAEYFFMLQSDWLKVEIELNSLS